MRPVHPLHRRAAALALIAIIAATAVMTLSCRKSPYEEHAPKLSRITVFATGGNALWTWNESRHALVEGPAPADLPALEYGRGWSQGGQDVEGPWVNASASQVKTLLNTDSLGLGPLRQIKAVTCAGAKRDLCFAAVCEMDKETVTSYSLRVCDEKNQTTGSCKSYRVEDRKLTACPAYFFAAAAF